jgi:hypothetical protein
MTHSLDASGAPALPANPEHIAERLFRYAAERGWTLEDGTSWDRQTETYKDSWRADVRWLLEEGRP